jgi:hypothetical protein
MMKNEYNKESERTKPSYRQILQNFKDKLQDSIFAMSNNNHHAAFFHDLVSREYYIQEENLHLSDDNLNCDYEFHPLPTNDKRIKFLPMINRPDDSVYEIEDGQMLSWMERVRDPINFLKLKKDYYFQKDSWIVKKYYHYLRNLLAIY